MDERLEKLLGLIQSLPSEQIVIITEKCKELGEVSPRVQKLVDIFNKLNEEEKWQFFRTVKPEHGPDINEPIQDDNKSEQPDE